MATFPTVVLPDFPTVVLPAFEFQYNLIIYPLPDSTPKMVIRMYLDMNFKIIFRIHPSSLY